MVDATRERRLPLCCVRFPPLPRPSENLPRDPHFELPGEASRRRHSRSSNPETESSRQARIRPIAGFTQPSARSRAEWLPLSDHFSGARRHWLVTKSVERITAGVRYTVTLDYEPEPRNAGVSHRGRRRTGLPDGYHSKERCYATWPTVYHRDAAVPWRARVRSSACLLPPWLCRACCFGRACSRMRRAGESTCPATLIGWSRSRRASRK